MTSVSHETIVLAMGRPPLSKESMVVAERQPRRKATVNKSERAASGAMPPIAPREFMAAAAESSGLIRSGGGGSKEVALLVDHRGTVTDDMEEIFGRGRLNISGDRLLVSESVRRISFKVNPALNWLRRMCDVAMHFHFPTYFRFFSLFRRPPKVGPGYSELIAQRETPESERPVIRLSAPAKYTGRIFALSALAIGMFGIVFLVGLYVTLGPEGSVIERPIAFVTANRLNCRAKPSLQSEVLQVATLDEKLDLLGESISWWRVQIRGKECWVSSDYVKLAGSRREQRKRSWLDLH